MLFRSRCELERLRDAVLFVHDATVAGMNAGRDVNDLVREIRLPPELEVGEGYGRVAWGVRAIWEGYAGWFHQRSTTVFSSPGAANRLTFSPSVSFGGDSTGLSIAVPYGSARSK